MTSHRIEPRPAGAATASLSLPPSLVEARGTEPAVVWDALKARLKLELGADVYESWFARMDVEGIVDGGVHLSVPTRFLKQWIQGHYRDRLLEMWAQAHPDVRRIEVSVRGAASPAPAPASSPRTVAARAPAVPSGPVYVETQPGLPGAPAKPTVDDGLGSPLDKRMSFQTLIVGRSNSVAHAAAVQVAHAAPNDPIAFNPLYVHAGVGNGKSHLLQAIAQKARENGRRVVYLTAERFMYGFVQALKSGGAIGFKEQIRGIDLLLIDDVQFLQGRQLQAEFSHTLNALLDGSRQVVIAGDRPPSDLETLDDRLRSRLAGGLLVETGAPDEEMRVRILRGKLEAARERFPNLKVPEAVISYVAQGVATNGRDLDGALNRLIAHNQFSGAALTVDMAEEVLKDLIRVREPKRVKIEDIQRICAKHYGVPRQDLLSSRRTRNVVLPRQTAMYLSKALTLRSLPEIGRRFGGRDHTTVLHAVRKIEELIKTDQQLAQDVELIKRLLLDA